LDTKELKKQKKFASFYKQTSNLLYHYILKRVRNNEKSLDILQNSYLKIFPEFENLNYPKSYLYKTAYHLIIDNTQKQKKEQSLRQTLHVNTKHQDRNQYLQLQIEKALTKLKQKDKDVFELKTYQGLSYKQISQITDLTCKAVESILTRVRNFLRIELKSLREFGYLNSLTQYSDEQKDISASSAKTTGGRK